MTIELPEEVELTVVVEGKPPTYYACGQKRPIKMFPRHVKEKDCRELDGTTEVITQN